MSFEVTLAATQLASILNTKGTLDSKVSEVFKAKSEKAMGMEPTDITIDFSSLQEMDASAAGMLMFMNYAAKNKGKKITITRASKSVLEVMNRANLGKLITIK